MPDYPDAARATPRAGLGMRGALPLDAQARLARQASHLRPRRVEHLWLVDPADRTLEALELREGQCPFDPVTFNLGGLWP